MALEGYTSFVIEGEKGKEIYDQIMNLKSQCEQQKEEGIAVATFGEMSYYMAIYEINGEEKLCLYVGVPPPGLRIYNMRILSCVLIPSGDAILPSCNILRIANSMTILGIIIMIRANTIFTVLPTTKQANILR